MSDKGVTASSNVTYAEDINRQQQTRIWFRAWRGCVCHALAAVEPIITTLYSQTDQLEPATALDVLLEGASKPAVSINHLALISSSFHRGDFQQQRGHKAGISHVCFIQRGAAKWWVTGTASWSIPGSTALPGAFQANSASPAL